MTKPKSWGGMVFRDIEMFNLALLATQAWQVLQNSTSLSACVLKAVYFLKGEFLEAAVGDSPSRAWGAIAARRDVLLQGIICRIGTGEQTRIWSMNWLPRDGLLRPLSMSRENPHQLVSELINPTTTTWDQNKLQTFFSPTDSETIGNILSMSGQQDFWAWHYEKNGDLVRSTYRMLVNKDARMIDSLFRKQS